MTKTQRVTQFIKDVRLQTANLPEQFNNWLAGMSTVQFQAFISALLALGTAVIYWITMLKEITIESVNFGMWLGFVAAYGGIAYKQFAKKRDSYKPEILSKQNLGEEPHAQPGGPIG